MMLITRVIFLAGVILSYGKSQSLNEELNFENLPNQDTWRLPIGGNSSWQQALSTMSFHRDRMNEYLCRRYVAEDIVKSLSNSTTKERMSPMDEDSMHSSKQGLLEDPGSSGYKNWLERSTTLEDIYRHYEGLQGEEDAPVPAISGSYDGGQITGYGMMGSKAGDVMGHSGYGAGTSYSVPEYEPHSSGGGDEKGMKIKELIHLALTGVAFLAFKTFLIEVIMCITDKAMEEEAMPTVLPMGYYREEDTDSSLRGETEEQSGRVNTMNKMAAHVLASMEGLAVLQQDGGDCLRRSLCEANSYARSLPGTQKIWLPLWSLGSSWIAGRIARRPSTWASDLFGHLQAAVLGFGNAECAKQYPRCEGTGRQSRRKRQVLTEH